MIGNEPIGLYAIDLGPNPAGGGTTFDQSVSGSLTLSSTLLKNTLFNVVGSITSAGSITKLTSFNTTGSCLTNSALVKYTSTSMNGSITTSAGPVTGGSFNQSAAGSITLTSVLTDAVTFVRTYGSIVTLSGVLAKPVYKLLVGSIALTATLLKHTIKATFTAALNLSSVLSAFSFTPGPGGGAVGRGLRFLRRFIGRR